MPEYTPLEIYEKNIILEKEKKIRLSGFIGFFCFFGVLFWVGTSFAHPALNLFT